ncbi:peptidoglycan DD-metalloendopeptidase family protein [Agromyces sp. NPDC057865]|uniref:peptidoglycan DD-metalloendopeptidase family protein n=1 Tax=Agromyces sp. NPDC057865 TaxID=3346267 RepID=UPI00366CC989
MRSERPLTRRELREREAADAARTAAAAGPVESGQAPALSGQGFGQQAVSAGYPQAAAPVYPSQQEAPVYPSQPSAPVLPQQPAALVFPQQVAAPVVSQQQAAAPAFAQPAQVSAQQQLQATSQPQAWQPAAHPGATHSPQPQASPAVRPAAQPVAPTAPAAQHPTAAQPARPGFDDLFGGLGAAPHETIEAPVRRRVAATTPNPEAEQADRPTGRGSASSMSRPSDAPSARGRGAERRPAGAEAGGFDALFAGLGEDDESDEPVSGTRGRSPRKAEKPKKPSRAEKAAAKREASAKGAGPRRGSSVPSAPRPMGGVDFASLVAGGGASIAGALGAAAAGAASVGASAASGSASATAPGVASELFGSATPTPHAAGTTPARSAAASPIAPPAGAPAGFASAISAAAGARPGPDPAVPARALLNLDRSAGRADATRIDADVTGVSDLLDFGSASDAAPAAAPTATRRSAQRSEPAREAPRSAGPARRWAPQAASRPAARPAASAPRRRRATRQLASLVAMSFAALLAVATTIPSLSLLTPEDVQALALSDTSGFGRDGQRVTINGDVVAAQGVQREGYEHMSMSEVAEAAGIRAEADFVNNPAGTIQWPFAVGVHIGDHFGYRNCAGCSSDHGGQDFNPGLGAEIQAIADGTVAVSTDSGGSLGVVMMIDHQINGELVTSVYAHMIEGSRRFEVGDTVHVADVIGQTGNTGMSTGPHLHFEIRLGGVNGTKVDPLEWLYANTN